KTLIDDIENNPKSRIVIEHSIQICKSLGNTISLAEGIETKGQLDVLAGYECDYGQGYYFSEPVCECDFENMLVSNRENPVWG
ncbi:MAG: EAL domain-containing protein, partial [Lachnospiraceae bacterium]|nr:EAL domain-containing protein [Lachnospiraceae bacterium]